MNYGLYLSASGVLTNMYRQDVFANNLANVETVAFKPDMATTRQRNPEATENRLGFDVSKKMLDMLGGGVLAGPQRIDFTPGALRKTGNEHDVALENKHHFFAVGVVDPDTGKQTVKLTRDGRISANAAGELVLPSGHKVLDSKDQPIVVNDDALFAIDRAGNIRQNGAVVARLQVARVEQLERLTKAGQNLFTFTGDDPRTILENPSVQPGFIEASAADPIATLMKLVASTKAATGNANMIRYHDLLMDHAINRLGRVA